MFSLVFYRRFVFGGGSCTVNLISTNSSVLRLLPTDWLIAKKLRVREYESIIIYIIEEHINHPKNHGVRLNMHKLFYVFTTDLICRIELGIDYGALNTYDLIMGKIFKYFPCYVQLSSLVSDFTSIFWISSYGDK